MLVEAFDEDASEVRAFLAGKAKELGFEGFAGHKAPWAADR